MYVPMYVTSDNFLKKNETTSFDSTKTKKWGEKSQKNSVVFGSFRISCFPGIPPWTYDELYRKAPPERALFLSLEDKRAGFSRIEV